jgi:hypothetical protein
MNSTLGLTDDWWKVFCIKAPAEEVIFCSQLLIAYIVILVSLINLCFNTNNICLWSTLASGTIGYLLPSPSLKPIKMSQFYLTLPSNASMKYYPDNTMAKYTTTLSNRIELDGDWEVGLAEIIYPCSWYNVKQQDCLCRYSDETCIGNNFVYRAAIIRMQPI